MRYSQGWLAYLVSAKMACKTLRLSGDEGLAKTYLNQSSGKVCCPHESCFSKRLLFSSKGLSHHYRINILEIVYVVMKK